MMNPSAIPIAFPPDCSTLKIIASHAHHRARSQACATFRRTPPPWRVVFIPKREPIRTYHSVPLDPPAGAFRRLWWNLFGKKYEIQQTVTPVYPDIDTVILNCPICNGAIGTTKNHAIAALEPLTINTPITCPYCRTYTFKVVEGKIMLA